MVKSLFIVMMTAGLAATSVQADTLREAAQDVAQCSQIRDPDVRLACFDAAAAPLASALDQTQVEGRTGASASSDRAGAAVEAEAPSSQRSHGSNAEESAVEGDSDTPTWATAPIQEPKTRAEQADRFSATIVRITRNNVGRHWFYTDDGAVWVQTQLEEFRAPESLPAVAEFRRKLTGNPTIKFDVSNQAYRVRRVE